MRGKVYQRMRENGYLSEWSNEQKIDIEQCPKLRDCLFDTEAHLYLFGCCFCHCFRSPSPPRDCRLSSGERTLFRHCHLSIVFCVCVCSPFSHTNRLSVWEPTCTCSLCRLLSVLIFVALPSHNLTFWFSFYFVWKINSHFLEHGVRFGSHWPGQSSVHFGEFSLSLSFFYLFVTLN